MVTATSSQPTAVASEGSILDNQQTRISVHPYRTAVYSDFPTLSRTNTRSIEIQVGESVINREDGTRDKEQKSAEAALSVSGSSSASMLPSTLLLPIIPAECELLDVICKLLTAIFNSISNKSANYYDSLVKLTSQILHVPSENVHRKFDKTLQAAKISLLTQQTQLNVPQPTPLTHQLSRTQLV